MDVKKNVKMSINYTKSWFVVSRDCKFTCHTGYVLKISINHSVLKEERDIKQHQKKLILCYKKYIKIEEDENDILQHGLKHGFAIHSKENDMLAYAEDFWEQIDKANICNNNIHLKSKI